jgi:nitrite reductase/ring-hydroxylating ferredoxin subunit
MDSVCSHEGGPLEEGTLICPWHHILSLSMMQARSHLKSYPVIVDDASGEVSIDTG